MDLGEKHRRKYSLRSDKARNIVMYLIIDDGVSAGGTEKPSSTPIFA